jgi:hypothetical protein
LPDPAATRGVEPKRFGLIIKQLTSIFSFGRKTEMPNPLGFTAKQGVVLYFALIASLGLFHFGCRTPEPIILGNQQRLLSDAFAAFKQSINQEGRIPLDPSGIPDLIRLGVSSPSTVNAAEVFWRKNLDANDLDSAGGDHVIGMIADDMNEDSTFHVFLLYSNGMIVSTATSKQAVEKWATKLSQRVNFSASEFLLPE